jgi:hypothetical protein
MVRPFFLQDKAQKQERNKEIYRKNILKIGKMRLTRWNLCIIIKKKNFVRGGDRP